MQPGVLQSGLGCSGGLPDPVMMQMGWQAAAVAVAAVVKLAVDGKSLMTSGQCTRAGDKTGMGGPAVTEGCGVVGLGAVASCLNDERGPRSGGQKSKSFPNL